MNPGLLLNRARPGSLCKPDDIQHLFGTLNISGAHFALWYGEKHSCSWPGSHVLQFMPLNALYKWQYIKGFPPGEFKAARRLFDKLEHLWPCHFLAKEYGDL